MWVGFMLVLAGCSVVAQTPDSATQVTCSNPVRVVLINTILGTECTVRGMAGGLAVSVPFSAFGFAVSEANGYAVNVNPTNNVSALSFSFQLQILDRTGPFVLTNAIGAPEINFTVVTIPGPLTELNCPSRQRVNETCNCTVIPRDATGAVVWVEANKFAFSGLDRNNKPMTWSGPNPAISNNFVAQGTFPSSSIFTVSNGRSSRNVDVAALDDPDSTSVIRCEPDVVPVNTITVCTIDTKKQSKSVTVLQSIFTLGGLNEGTTYSPITVDDSPLPLLGSRFTVTATVGLQKMAKPNANTGRFNFSDGVSTPFPVTVIVDPDQTSMLSCDSSEIVAGGLLSCTSVPRLVGVNVFCQTSLWQLSVVDKSGAEGDAVGRFSAISPPISGNSFRWSVTPNENLLGALKSVEIILNDGKSPQVTINVTAPLIPDSTTTMSCNVTTLYPSQRTLCFIYPKLSNSPISAKASAFTLTDTQGGNFSGLTPAAGKVLTFEYTVKPTASGAGSISNGIGSRLTITVTGKAPTAAPPTRNPPVPTPPTASRPPTAAPIEEGGGMGTTGVVLLVLSIIVVAVAIFLGWSYKKKMDSAKVMPLDDNLYAPPGIN